MKFTTKVGVVLLLVAGASIVVGAGSFTSTEADRPVNVSVVPDDQAYIGFQIGNYPPPMNKDTDGNVDYEVELYPQQSEGYAGSGVVDLSLNILEVEANLFPEEESGNFYPDTEGEPEGYVYEDVLYMTNQFDSELEGNITVSSDQAASETFEFDSVPPGGHVPIDIMCEGGEGIDILGLVGIVDVTRQQKSEIYNLSVDVYGETETDGAGAFNRSVQIECVEESQSLEISIL